MTLTDMLFMLIDASIYIELVRSGAGVAVPSETVLRNN